MFSNEFDKAAIDYQWLINRGYNDRSCKKFVGDRYGLSGTERSILYRGIFNNEESDKRRQKLIKLQNMQGAELHIDGFNLLFSLVAYLSGKMVFIATDGLMRDAAEYHGKNMSESLVKRAVQLVIEVLLSMNIIRVDFLLDKPMRNSNRLVELIRNAVSETDLKGSAEAFYNADHMLLQMRQGILCTSDSRVIDSSDLPVFDLAKHVLSFHFQPDFYKLVNIL